jgi:uncharacterized Zn-binding protein involved in type VI secretion
VITKGCENVLINKLPAARAGDDHVCLLPPTAGPHPPNKIAQGSGSVLIGGLPAARMKDLTACGATIVSGSPNVVIGD